MAIVSRPTVWLKGRSIESMNVGRSTGAGRSMGPHQFWPKQKYIKVMVGHAKRGETGDDLSHLFCDKRVVVVVEEASNPCLSSLHIIEQLLE